MTRIISLLLLLSVYLIPQQKITSPQLTTMLDNKKEALKISKVKAEVTILNEIAQTKLTLTFTNQFNRQLEGNFLLPMPEGSLVNSYALDINGKMVDGVAVEKKKARVVFENITRRKIDPGLAEWVEGEAFRTRIFPIPAKGSRTISITYSTNLTIEKNKLIYKLPLNIDDKLDKLFISVKTLNHKVKPKTFKKGKVKLKYSDIKKGYYAESQGQNITPPAEISVQIPVSDISTPIVDSGVNGTYFATTLSFKEIIKAEKASYKKISIYWDNSLSELGTTDMKLQFLKELFARYKRNIDVELIPFNIRKEKAESFSVNRKGTTKLFNKIRRINYDGATDLNCVLGDIKDRDTLYLIFTNGLDTFSSKVINKIKTQVYFINAAVKANHALMRNYANLNNGRYINLNGMKAEVAAELIGKQSMSFMGYDIEKGEIIDLFPQKGTPVTPSMTFTGRVQSSETVLKLNFGVNGVVKKSRRVVIKDANSFEENIVPLYWAQAKVNSLLYDSVGNKEEITEIGKKFSMVTPWTSLLVLDNLNQYIENRIPPPESLPDMRSRYFQRIKQIAKDKKEEADEYIEDTIDMWKDKVDWWLTKYPLPEVKDKKPTTYPDPVQDDLRIVSPNSDNSGMKGVVTDSSGWSIPGVIITLEGSNIKRMHSVADENGNYFFKNLPKGSYTITFNLDGLKQVRFTNINYQENSLVRRDAIMTMSNIEERILCAGVSRKMGPAPRPVPTRSIRRGEGVRGTFTNSKGETVKAVIGGVPSAPKQPTENSESISQIKLKAWTPDAYYLKEIERAKDKAYIKYLDLRAKYINQPAFYMDCSDFFYKKGDKKTAIKIVSNLAEMKSEAPSLLRIMGYRLTQMKAYKEALFALTKVRLLRPEEPQGLRDIALLYNTMGRYKKAIRLLYAIVEKEWKRFQDISLIALTEMNAIVSSRNIYEKYIKKKFRHNLTADIRVVLTWDTDSTDMDLWVTEPTGEKVFYENDLSKLGGRISEDYTDGYGPEEYLIKDAPEGKYKIQADYFGKNSSRAIGPVTLRVDVFTDFGRPNQKQKTTILRLKKSKDVIDVAEIEYKKSTKEK